MNEFPQQADGFGNCVPYRPFQFFGAVVSFIVLRPILEAMFTSSSHSSSSSDSRGKIIAFFIAAAIGMFTLGIAKIRKVIKSINLTQAQSIFNFVKKRQE